jgi:hypothetical protein
MPQTLAQMRHVPLKLSQLFHQSSPLARRSAHNALILLTQ